MYTYDADQMAAINIDRGEHLVLGAAGTGKTAVLSERVRQAISNGVSPASMACITYTKRASARMFESITDGQDMSLYDGLYVGSVHNLCTTFLRDKEVILQDTGVIGTDEAAIILEGLALDRKITLEDKIIKAAIQYEHFIHQIRKGHPVKFMKCPDLYDKDAIKLILKYNNLPEGSKGLVSLFDNVGAIITKKDYSSSAPEILQALMVASWYRNYKKSNNLIDFDDELIMAYDYMVENPGSYRKFSWVEVDETQDIDLLQHTIINLMTEDDAVKVYFADEQQAIMSFMGVKLDVLRSLQDRIPPENTIYLKTNYRSKDKPLQVQRQVAVKTMNSPSELIPDYCSGSDDKGSFNIISTKTKEEELDKVAQMCSGTPDGMKTLVAVPNRFDGGDICSALESRGIPYINMTSKDIMKDDSVRLILSHFAAVTRDHDFMNWSAVLDSMVDNLKGNDVRRLLIKLRENAACASDLLRSDGLSYLLEYKTAMKGRVVFFDTETTGLDTEEDDIVQIAAIRMNGQTVEKKLNIILHTDRTIPEKLGDKLNPLVEAYRNTTPIDRAEGLSEFMNFCKGCSLVAHNAEFDYNILDANLRRDLNDKSLRTSNPKYYDTLKVARLVDPDRKTYRLEALIAAYGLEGVNSHLADDDIDATVKLSYKLMSLFSKKENDHIAFLSKLDVYAMKARLSYGELYEHTRKSLSEDVLRGRAFSLEMRYVHDALVAMKKITPVSRIDELATYLGDYVLEQENGYLLGTLLRDGMNLLLSAKESDMIECGAVSSNVVVSTPLRAKGLQFDNVIMFHLNNGVWPHYNSKTDEAVAEDARKFYVGISRSKSNLTLFYRESEINRYGRKMQLQPSEFLDPLYTLSDN